jgi:hypothetical protein
LLVSNLLTYCNETLYRTFPFLIYSLVLIKLKVVCVFIYVMSVMILVEVVMVMYMFFTNIVNLPTFFNIYGMLVTASVA